MGTVETALGVATLVAVVVVCAAGLGAILTGVRCTDAAREAARLAARGDQVAAAEAVRAVAPAGAQLRLHREGGFVVATVTAASALPGVPISARAVAAVEPTASG
ncbi:TadE family type IV pilus minor pilin [[Mycobacterium] wendilense]|uniref:TadE family type IV pilus minor pilin n=1 Tax=[Mycobacterium] wendilense TaxID=3064284 RepID=A0ABM9M8J6_9MYCO|nr:TadE family type IV pilus minor pilin [Mycolicibacterium sp. MU0050]CAJ1579055.1 TadE family type IV pilus minor pilin [Mycolicibacterium sp. MU0050]